MLLSARRVGAEMIKVWKHREPWQEKACLTMESTGKQNQEMESSGPHHLSPWIHPCLKPLSRIFRLNAQVHLSLVFCHRYLSILTQTPTPNHHASEGLEEPLNSFDPIGPSSVM